VAECCRVLQSVALCYSVSRCVASNVFFIFMDVPQDGNIRELHTTQIVFV